MVLYYFYPYFILLQNKLDSEWSPQSSLYETVDSYADIYDIPASIRVSFADAQDIHKCLSLPSVNTVGHEVGHHLPRLTAGEKYFVKVALE